MKKALQLATATICLLIVTASCRKAGGPATDDFKSRQNEAGVEWVYSKPTGLYFTRSEVTAEQFLKCVLDEACHTKNLKTKNENEWCNWGHADRSAHPINCINWHGADQFCSWVGGRLPTENEWYKEASNGGGRKYPWGAEEASCAYSVMLDKGKLGCGKNSTWPVCSKRAGDSVSGLCDMSGNVWEWTSTKDGSDYVLLGGSWSGLGPNIFKASGRLGFTQTGRGSGGGFRCVRSH